MWPCVKRTCDLCMWNIWRVCGCDICEHVCDSAKVVWLFSVCLMNGCGVWACLTRISSLHVGWVCDSPQDNLAGAVLRPASRGHRLCVDSLCQLSTSGPLLSPYTPHLTLPWLLSLNYLALTVFPLPALTSELASVSVFMQPVSLCADGEFVSIWIALERREYVYWVRPSLPQIPPPGHSEMPSVSLLCSLHIFLRCTEAICKFCINKTKFPCREQDIWQMTSGISFSQGSWFEGMESTMWGRHGNIPGGWGDWCMVSTVRKHKEMATGDPSPGQLVHGTSSP